MTDSTPRQIVHPGDWPFWIGAVVLTGLAVYALATGTGAGPRYPIALIAIAASSVAHKVNEHADSVRLRKLEHMLFGGAYGLLVGGLL